MVINDVYNLAGFIINKVKAGQLKPANFNEAIKSANRSLFQDKYKEFEKTGKINDDISVFYATASLSVNSTTGKASVPADYAYKILFTDSNAYPIDMPKMEHWGYNLNSKIKPPATNYGIVRRVGTDFEFRPKTIGTVTLDYLKLPTEPEWAYTTSSGRPVFASGSSTDVDWNENLTEELTNRVLSYFGVSLKDGEVFEYANAMKQQEP